MSMTSLDIYSIRKNQQRKKHSFQQKKQKKQQNYIDRQKRIADKMSLHLCINNILTEHSAVNSRKFRKKSLKKQKGCCKFGGSFSN